MTDFLKIARSLEMQREDMKWYANVEAMAEALAEAHMRGLVEGQRHAIDMMVQAQQRENEALRETVDAMPPFDESKAERDAYEKGRAFERLSQAMTTEAESTEAHDREKDAYERGVNDGLTGRRERAVSIRDDDFTRTSIYHCVHGNLRMVCSDCHPGKLGVVTDGYAPPVGPVALCNEETAKESAQVEIETPGAFYRGKYAKPSLTFISRMVELPFRDFYAGDPVLTAMHEAPYSEPQPDGDGRFPGEAE